MWSKKSSQLCIKSHRNINLKYTHTSHHLPCHHNALLIAKWKEFFSSKLSKIILEIQKGHNFSLAEVVCYMSSEGTMEKTHKCKLFQGCT